jgi:hypothetical protein
LRLIDQHIDFDFIRVHLKDSYSDTGRPSIDPELLLRILLIGYLYGISSERKLVENCGCTWPGAGSHASASIRKFRLLMEGQCTHRAEMEVKLRVPGGFPVTRTLRPPLVNSRGGLRW